MNETDEFSGVNHHIKSERNCSIHVQYKQILKVIDVFVCLFVFCFETNHLNKVLSLEH